METCTVNDSNPDHSRNSKSNSQFRSFASYQSRFQSQSMSNSVSHSRSFLAHNGVVSSKFQISDIEMITLHSPSYTSLKDLLPPAQAIMSPTQSLIWHQVPIKNPLVKHAALAYLQPRSTPPEAGDVGFVNQLKNCSFGCFDWFNETVFRTVVNVFIRVLDRRKDGFGHGEDEFEEEEAEKTERAEPEGRSAF